MGADGSLQRYELMEERRTDERREDRQRRFGRRAADRRGNDRRGRRSLAAAPPVRRIWPMAEGTAPPGVQRRETAQRAMLAAADGLAVAAGLTAVHFVAGAPMPALFPLAGALVVILLAKIAGLYDRDALVLRRSTLDEAPRVLQLTGLVTLTIWLAFDVDLNRGGVLLLWGALGLGVCFARFLARVLSRRILPRECCLVIGDRAVAEQIRKKVAASRAGARVVGVLPLATGETAEAFGGVAGLRALVNAHQLDRVILAPVSTDAADMLELIRVAKQVGVRVSVLPRLFEVVGSAVEFEDVDGMTMLGVRRFGLPASSRAIKRAFDIVGSSLLLLAVAPLLAIVALAVRVDSPGPIFFRQRRVGREGEPFCMLKFRSMVPDAEEQKATLRHLNEAGRMFKIAADPRTTRVGRFLRKTSLDELPQLINVLRGDMSLVGPRPLVLDEDEKILGLDRVRLHLTPGMTGHWQVLGSSRIPMEEMLGIDYLYVAGWSLWTDLKILIRTVPHVLRRSGQ
jgi:exopolysaccharide biosynthesis polyprenyl glycosylphosphotransferase